MSFDLQAEVRAWCRSALPDGCHDEAVAELEDHLHCEIERLQQEGHEPSEAFSKATQRLGKARDIMTEYGKNQSFVARLCALDRRLSGVERIEDPVLRRKSSRLIVGHAILWAAAMLASALLVQDSENAGYLVTLVFIPMWFMSFLMINQAFVSIAGRRQ